MGSWRGDETAAGDSGFVAIDDDRIGDGSAKARPVSTWLENRIVSNYMYLARGVNAVGIAPITANAGAYTSATGDRPWAAINDWISVGFFDVPVSRGLKGIRIGGLYNVEAIGATQSAVDLKIRFGAAEKIVELANTQSGGNPKYESLDATLSDLDLDLPDVIGETIGDTVELSIWMRSKPGAASGTFQTLCIGLGPFIEAPNAATIFNESGSGNPDADSLEVHYLHATAFAAYTGQSWEMLHRVTSGSGGTANPTMAVRPYAYSGGMTLERYAMSYLQLRSLWIQPRYTATSLGEVSQKSIEASAEVTGQVATTHATALRRLQRRPRPIAYGPRGILDSTYEHYQALGYPYRWPFVMGDAAAANILGLDGEGESVVIDAEDPTIWVRLSLIAVQHRTSNRHHLTLTESLGSARWTLTLEIDQLKDLALGGAAWGQESNTTTLISGSAISVELPLYSAGYESSSPFLRQMAQANTYDDGTGASDLEFSYKEGSLYEEDVQLVRKINVTGKMSGFTTAAITELPCRLVVTAALEAGTTPVYVNQLYATTADIRLVCVGWSAFAVANEE